MKALIMDYGSGNVESVANALLKVADLQKIIISNKISDLKSANCLILPGVGSFGDCMSGLNLVEGFVPELYTQVLKVKKPFLGICVGMQVLASVGHEDGETQGLGFINGEVTRISGRNLKIPHMGWNNVSTKPIKHKVLDGIKNNEHFYFANSYHFICQNEEDALADVEYGSKFNAIIAKENVFGVQFHPEKSSEAGLRLLKNFLNWRV